MYKELKFLTKRVTGRQTSNKYYKIRDRTQQSKTFSRL